MKQITEIGDGSIKYLETILDKYSPRNIMLVTGHNSYDLSGAKKKVDKLLSKYNITHFYEFVRILKNF